MRKSKYKSKIIKQRKARLLGEIDKALDALKQSVSLTNEQLNAEVEQLIQASPDYAEISHLCTKIIPLYEDFSLDTVAFEAAAERLVYNFASNAEWAQVKEFYKEWFLKQGWQFLDESDDLPRLDKIVVKTDNYKIILCDASILDHYLLTGEKI